MKVSTERLEDCQMVLNIEVEPEALEQSLERASRRLAARTTIPGFRKGKAPRQMLERYLGRAALLEEALELLVPESYNQAIEEHQVPAFAEPRIEILQLEPVVFKATVPLRPVVQLGDYRQLRLQTEPITVPEEELEATLEGLRYRSAPWEPTERPAAFGDLLTIDVEGTVEGEPLIRDAEVEYPLMKDMPVPVPGFVDQLEGMEKGQVKEFTLVLPQDYRDQALAGKPSNFTVTLRELKEKRLPELDDEFAKGIGEEYETLQQLREHLAADLQNAADRNHRRQLEEEAIQAVIGMAQVEYPSVLVEHEIDHLIQEQEGSLRDSKRSMEEYLRTLDKTVEDLREEWRPVATQRVVRSLTMGQLAQDEEIQVDPQEVEEEIERMVSSAGENRDTLRSLFDSPVSRDSIARFLLNRKTLERLVEITTGSSPGEEQADPENPPEVEASGQLSASETSAGEAVPKG